MPRLPINATISGYHFKRTGSTEAYDTQPAYQNVNACVSPTGTDYQPSGEVLSFQLFEIFLYDVTITVKPGDKLITQDTQTYIVDGVPFVMNQTYLRYIRCMGHQLV